MTPGRAERDFEEFRRSGSPAALARVFDAFAPELLIVAGHLTRDLAAAEDLVQSTFLQAIESATSFDAGRRLMPWLKSEERIPKTSTRSQSATLRSDRRPSGRWETSSRRRRIS